MTKKKKSQVSNGISQSNDLNTPTSTISKSDLLVKKENKSQGAPTIPALVICRNKHWRYISSYHGPWLNLPPEVLESLAYSNFYSPSPRPIDPAVFFDLIKIRRLVEDATSLAVRAANGTTAASLTNSLSAGNGTEAEMLGIGASRGGGGNAKLSRERRFRMREHATSKLYHAYTLDEIATSVATMQSASALDDVAKHVLQRDENDLDAQYVHFFHEKIPSRTMAESTPLTPLNNIIQHRPTDPAPYRTRAVTRVFKEDYHGSARDLTEAIAVHRLYHADHEVDQRELILAREASKLARDAKIDEKDQPSSTLPQLLFHRAGVFLTLACQHIVPALVHVNGSGRELNTHTVQDAPSMAFQLSEDVRSCLEARKLVRTYAKRALKDYMGFLSHFEYTPGLSADFTQAFLDNIAAMANSSSKRSGSRSEFLLDVESHTRGGISDALIKYEHRRNRQRHSHDNADLHQIPRPPVHKVNELFKPVPPGGLPTYPFNSQNTDGQSPERFLLPDFSEAVTYHPLILDVLHSLLLCHCLVQTSVKEHQRHAYMAARIVRICDGYPIFLTARSPARADWMEVVRKTKNWLGLEQTWEELCTPSAQQSQRRSGSQSTSSALTKRTGHDVASGSKEDRLERIKRNAIREALADEKVVDEETFLASVRAREARAIAMEDEEMRKEYHTVSSYGKPTNGSTSVNAPVKDATLKGSSANCSKRMTSDDSSASKSHDYLLGSERAEMISRWIREAPGPGAPGEASVKRKTAGNGKKSAARSLRKQASDMSAMSTASGLSNASVISLGSEATTCGLEESIDSLNMVD